MAKLRGERKSSASEEVRGRRSRETLRDSVFHLTSEMEEPLRHALQMVRVIGLINPHEDEDREAISFVAHEAVIKLAAVSDRVRALFAACEPS